MPVIPALGRLKQDNCKFEASLVYTARPYHKTRPRTKSDGYGVGKKFIYRIC
jgi:hypothetical protein